MADHNTSNFGNYVLHERIGIGGMAEIFRATAEVDDIRRSLVIKRILSHLSEDESFVRMFIEEAKLCIFLRHPNVVQVYDLGIVDDQYFIAMEYVEGRDLLKTLAACARQRVAFPTDLALYIVLQVLKALDYAHNLAGADGRHLGIIHRDVSPPNILLSYSGDIKLSDFGIAKASFREKTRTGIFKGKFGYMSPEQAMGETLDRRSDIFAVGILLYELLTGHRLFTGPNEVAIIEKVRTATIAPPLKHYRPDIGPELHQIVMKSLARRREDRFASAVDLHEAIYNYTFHNGVILSPRTLSRFMTQLFPEGQRSVGESVIGEPSWTNASSILDISDSVILGVQNRSTEEDNEEDKATQEQFETLRATEDQVRAQSLTEDTSVEHLESELRKVLARSSNLPDEDAGEDDDFTHQPTPFGGVPVLNLDSSKHLRPESIISLETGLDTIQGDEDFPESERTALEIAPEELQDDDTEALDYEDVKNERRRLSLNETRDEETANGDRAAKEVTEAEPLTEHPVHLTSETNIMFEDSEVFNQLAALPSDAVDPNAPFAGEILDDQTKAEAIPASLMDQLRNSEQSVVAQEDSAEFESIQGTEESQQGLEEPEDHNLPTSLGALDEYGSPDVISRALGLDQDDAPEEQSTGVRDAISEAAMVEEEIEEIRRASVIEANQAPAEHTALGALVGLEQEGLANAVEFWTPPQDDDQAKVAGANEEDLALSQQGTEEQDAFLQQNETIERQMLDEEGKRDVKALPFQDGGRLKDRGASDLFGALAILDDEESIGAFPSSFDGTDNSITDFSDNVSALVQDPATKELKALDPRREIVAPSVLAEAHEGDVVPSQEIGGNEETLSLRERQALAKARKKQSAVVRPSTPREAQEDQTPFAPGSLVPESGSLQEDRTPLPGFVNPVKEKDFAKHPQGLLSESFDLESRKPASTTGDQSSNVNKVQIQSRERNTSKAQKRRKVVQQARPIREKNSKDYIRKKPKSKLPKKVIPQADTRTFPGGKLRPNAGHDPQIPMPVVQEERVAPEPARPISFYVPDPSSHNYLVWGFVVLAAIFVGLAAAVRFSSDTDLVGIKRAFGLLNEAPHEVIEPTTATATNSPSAASIIPPVEINPQIPDAGLAPVMPEKTEERVRTSKTKKRPAPKVRRKKKPRRRRATRNKRRTTKKRATPKKTPRRRRAAPLRIEANKGAIKWSCQAPITVRIRRVGVFKSVKKKTVQVKPGNYVITVAQPGGAQSTKNTRVIVGEVAKIPCN